MFKPTPGNGGESQFLMNRVSHFFHTLKTSGEKRDEKLKTIDDNITVLQVNIETRDANLTANIDNLTHLTEQLQCMVQPRSVSSMSSVSSTADITKIQALEYALEKALEKAQTAVADAEEVAATNIALEVALQKAEATKQSAVGAAGAAKQSAVAAAEAEMQSAQSQQREIIKQRDQMIEDMKSQQREIIEERDETIRDMESQQREIIEERDQVITDMEGRLQAQAWQLHSQKAEAAEAAEAAAKQSAVAAAEAAEAAEAESQQREIIEQQDEMIRNIEERLLAQASQLVLQKAQAAEAAEAAEAAVAEVESAVAAAEAAAEAAVAEMQAAEKQGQINKDMEAGDEITRKMEEEIEALQLQLEKAQEKNELLEQHALTSLEEINLIEKAGELARERFDATLETSNAKLVEEQNNNTDLHAHIKHMNEDFQVWQIQYQELIQANQALKDEHQALNHENQALRQEFEEKMLNAFRDRDPEIMREMKRQDPHFNLTELLLSNFSAADHAGPQSAPRSDEISQYSEKTSLMQKIIEIMAVQMQDKGDGEAASGDTVATDKLKMMLNSNIHSRFDSFIDNVRCFSISPSLNLTNDESIQKQEHFCVFLFHYLAAADSAVLDVTTIVNLVEEVRGTMITDRASPDLREKYLQKAIIELLFIIVQDERIKITDHGKLSIIPSHLLLSICKTFVTYKDSDPCPSSKHTFPLRIHDMEYENGQIRDLQTLQNLRDDKGKYDEGKFTMKHIGPFASQISEDNFRAIQLIDLKTKSVWLPDDIQDKVLGFLVKRPQNLFELRCFLNDSFISNSQYEEILENLCSEESYTDTQMYETILQLKDDATETRKQAFYVHAIVMLTIFQTICKLALEQIKEDTGGEISNYTITFEQPEEEFGFVVRFDVHQATWGKNTTNVVIPNIVFTETSTSSISEPPKKIKVEHIDFYTKLVSKFILGNGVSNTVLNRLNFEIVVVFKLIMKAIGEGTSIGFLNAFEAVIQPEIMSTQALFDIDFIAFIKNNNLSFCEENYEKTMNVEDLYQDLFLKNCMIKRGMEKKAQDMTSFADFFSRIAQAQNADEWQALAAGAADTLENEAGTPELSVVGDQKNEAGSAVVPAAGVPQQAVLAGSDPEAQRRPSNNGAAATNAPASHQQWVDSTITQLKIHLDESKRRIMSGGKGNYWKSTVSGNKNALGYFRLQLRILLEYRKQTQTIRENWPMGEIGQGRRPKPNETDFKRYIHLLNGDVHGKAAKDDRWKQFEADKQWKQMLTEISELKDIDKDPGNP